MSALARLQAASFAIATQLRRYRGLIFSLVHRDITMRFRQSAFSFLWLFFQPLLLLLVYSFVFQVVLKVRWGEASFAAGPVPVGLLLFVGLTIHTLLAEALIRCPAIITSNTSYVKKVVFPLALLPVVVIFSALVVATVALVLIIGVTLGLLGSISPWTPFLFVPILSLACMSLGIGWLVAALGVYFRDINQMMPFVTTILLFTAPICYPKEMVPGRFAAVMQWNPLTIPVDTARAMIFGGGFSIEALAVYGVVSVFIMFVGYAFFQRLRAGFADVL
jgi:lipopolysaccharide transport system permease protein